MHGINTIYKQLTIAALKKCVHVNYPAYGIRRRSKNSHFSIGWTSHTW